MKIKSLILTLVCIVFALQITHGEETDTLIRNKPKISVQKAIQLAEKYVAEKKLEISQRFISSVRYIGSGSWTNSYIGNGPYWQITWELIQPADGGQYFVLVYMNGKVGHASGL